MKIALFFGGRGPEHTVSVHSAAYLYPKLCALGHTVFSVGICPSGAMMLLNKGTLPDESWQKNAVPLSICLADGGLVLKTETEVLLPTLAFSVVHGKDGEDGVLQGLFTFGNLSYIGSAVAASAVCMNKRLTKELVSLHGVPIVPFVSVRRFCEQTPARIAQKLRYPLFVKPASSGSSVGVSRVSSEGELQNAILAALAESEEALVEEAIAGSELEVGVLSRDGTLLLSPPGEIRVSRGFYDYQAKYEQDTAEILLPAPLSLWETAYVKQLAATVFRTCGCRDYARVDFLRRKDGKIFFNEINTLPGFTESSLFPRLFSLLGVDAVTFLTEGRE